jgi:D-serine deaminase-like pyridoxal phosphate-dependent protein
VPATAGQRIDELDTPQLLIDLDILDANLARMQAACRERGVHLRVHFKSLKCGGLAKYLTAKGVDGFLCAKLNEAEVLAGAGITDILMANEAVGPIKVRRAAELARRVKFAVCVDDADNVRALAEAARAAGSTLGIYIEVDVGMHRCGVEPGEPALHLARLIASFPSLHFEGLQGYDGHLQMLTDMAEKKRRCLEALASLVSTRTLIESAGIPVGTVTGGGTGTWEFVASFPGMTELQPGSFLLMDAIYHQLRPEFACSLSILATVISRRPEWYVLDAGSKAISNDFGLPAIKARKGEKVQRLAEEHAIVACASPPKVGERREVFPAHCCATMNLHRACIAVRAGRVEATWPIEASGRYD